jgi:hypothetical protein
MDSPPRHAGGWLEAALKVDVGQGSEEVRRIQRLLQSFRRRVIQNVYNAQRHCKTRLGHAERELIKCGRRMASLGQPGGLGPAEAAQDAPGHLAPVRTLPQPPAAQERVSNAHAWLPSPTSGWLATPQSMVSPHQGGVLQSRSRVEAWIALEDGWGIHA